MSQRSGGLLDWRRWHYVNLHPSAWHKRGLSPLNRLVAVAIILAVGLAILQSEPMLYVGNETLFRAAETIFAVIFLAEYCGRIWIAGEDPEYGPTLRGRLRYMLTFASIIDLVALASLFLTLVGAEGSILRLFRLVRIVMLAKLGRYSSALNAIGAAIRSRRYELMMSLVIAGLLLLVSSTLLHMIEGEGQPDDFGSIPRAMWWSIATLTTVGLRCLSDHAARQGPGGLHRHNRHRPDRHADRHPGLGLQRCAAAAARSPREQGEGRRRHLTRVCCPVQSPALAVSLARPGL